MKVDWRGKMSLLEKLIKEGWFKKPEDLISREVELNELTDDQLDELIEKKSTIVYDNEKNPYIVIIPEDVDSTSLKNEDIKIKKLPFAARRLIDP